MSLTVPAALSIACGAVNLVFAALSAGIGWGGGWRAMRWFALVCLSAAVFNVTNVVLTLEVTAEVARWCSMFSLTAAGVHAGSWALYVSAERGRPLQGRHRLIVPMVLAAAALSLVPGLVVSTKVAHHDVRWLGVTYADALPTSFGMVVYAILVMSLFFPLVHYLREWRRGTRLAFAYALGLVALVVTGVSDALVGAAVLDLPYLLDIGFVTLIAASGGAMVHHFVTSSRELDRIKGKLEHIVAERTEQLAQTQTALAQSEKLAAVGNLAAGVAHEINNPTAAVLANLAYLLEPLSQGEPLPADARECIEESFTSTKRIGRIVRQLLDAGRVAGGQHGRIMPFSLARAVKAALANTRVQQQHVVLQVDVDEARWVRGDEDLLTQVLTNLVVNAAQAIAEVRPRGRIDISACVEGERVVLSVQDDGPGIPEAAQSRLFEPFFTTKPQGRGTGLGLAVSLGLMRAQGGDLRLQRTSAAGSTFVVELPACDAPVEHAANESAAPTPRAAMRLLLVDDDPIVLDALRRSLGTWFQVRAVDNVVGALELLREPAAFDLALCDVIMPDGGAERLVATLTEHGSPFVAKTLFMTAGAVTSAARTFVDANRSRVLQKPIEPAQLLALASSLTRSEAAAAQ